MEEFILNMFAKYNIEVQKLKYYENDSDMGLLHEPIKKFRAYTNVGEIWLVIKTESIKHPPEKLFRDLYIECGKSGIFIDLEQFDKCCHYLSIRDMPRREYDFYRNIPELMRKFVPEIWDCIIDDNRQIIIMEDLSQCINLNKIDSPEVWNMSFLLLTVQDLATIHYNMCSFRNSIHHEFDFKQISKFLLQFHSLITSECGIAVDLQVYDAGKDFISKLDKYENILSEEATIIHNDFNIRNICIEKNKEHLKVYDWEFLDIGCPMFDIVDLLLSISPRYINRKIIDKLIEAYVEHYSKLAGVTLSLEHYFDLLYYSALKYAATRMNMYLLCYKRKKLKYIERMYFNLRQILKLYVPNQ